MMKGIDLWLTKEHIQTEIKLLIASDAWSIGLIEHLRHSEVKLYTLNLKSTWWLESCEWDQLVAYQRAH